MYLFDAFAPSRNTRLLGIAVPTIEPDILYDRLLSDAMLSALEPIRDVSVFLINFQPPFRRNGLQKYISKLTNNGFSVKYRFNTYDTSISVPFNRIRNDCFRIDQNCPFYLTLDDDMMAKDPTDENPRSFGQQILDGLEYMIDHRMCGMIGYVKKPYHIDPYYKSKLYHKYSTIYPTGITESRYSTELGFMLRNLLVFDNQNTPTFPEDSLNLLGGGEEIILGLHYLSQGYYGARYSYANSTNKSNDNSTARNGWLSNNIMKNNLLAYIKNKYNIEYPISSRSTYKDDKQSLPKWKLSMNNRHDPSSSIVDELIVDNTNKDNLDRLLKIQSDYQNGTYHFKNKSKSKY